MGLNKEQRATLKRIALPLVGWVGFVIYCLWFWKLFLLGWGSALFGGYALLVEGLAIRQGGNSTLSELHWIVWATQPWAIWLITTDLSIIGGYALHAGRISRGELTILIVVSNIFFLYGHFLAQSREVYSNIRKEGDGDPR